MNLRSFIIKSLLTYLLVLASAGVGIGAETVPAQSPPSPARQSAENIFRENIDTHFGGRFKITGRAFRVDDDTIFEPLGTGTYWDGSFNLRLNNETFFTDSIFTEVAYELIGAGGDLVRKTNELKDMFPNIPADVFLAGAAIDDDRRLMDLTGTIADEDSYVLIHRLDRLSLALMPQWGSLKIGRQAITWGNGFIFNPFDLFNPFPPTAIDRDFKVGDDMLNAQVSIAGIVDLQGLYVVRLQPRHDPRLR